MVPVGVVRVRQAVVADAEPIAEVHVRAWQGAYQGLMPQEYLEGLSIADHATWWSRRLEGLPDGQRSVVVSVDDRVVGFASYGRPRDTDLRGNGRVGELYAINLHPLAWGTGAGSVLLAHTHEELAEMGFSWAVLWVVPGNVRARRFYEREGWSAEHVERTAQVRGVTVPEVRYRRPLGSLS